MPNASAPSLPRIAAATAYAAFSLALFISQFYRTAMALLAPILTDEMGLTAERLGFLAAAYFFAFALMQLPVGMMLDRFGPRRTVAGLTVLGISGALIFALAPGYGGLLLGQMLIGVGTAGSFTGGIVICARWFRPQRAAMLTGLMLGIGNLGGVLAATPLALALEAWGWRNTMLAMAAWMLIDGLLILMLVRDAPPGHAQRERKPETPGEILAGLMQVLRTSEIWRLMALAFVGFASVMTIRGLWGGPYLLGIHGLDSIHAGHVLLAMTVGVILGAVGYGALEQPFDTRRGVGLVGGSGLAATLALLAALPHPPLWLVIAAFVAIGVCGQTYIMVLAHGRAGFADRLVGRVITTLNMAAFVGTFALQALSGVIVRAFQEPDGSVPEAGYRVLFAFLAAVVAAALAIYAGSTDAKPSQDAMREKTG